LTEGGGSSGRGDRGFVFLLLELPALFLLVLLEEEFFITFFFGKGTLIRRDKVTKRDRQDAKRQCE